MLILAIWIKLYKVEVNDLVINVLLCCAMIILLGISVELKSGWLKELYYGMIWCTQVETIVKKVDSIDVDNIGVGSLVKVIDSDMKYIGCSKCDARWENEYIYLQSCGIIRFNEDDLRKDCTAWVMSYPFTRLFCNDVENNNKIKRYFIDTIKIMPVDKSTYNFDAEADNCWIYFTTKDAALEFLGNLNGFLEKRMAHWIEVNF
jgi:hypothetical protein